MREKGKGVERSTEGAGTYGKGLPNISKNFGQPAKNQTSTAGGKQKANFASSPFAPGFLSYFSSFLPSSAQGHHHVISEGRD